MRRCITGFFVLLLALSVFPSFSAEAACSHVLPSGSGYSEASHPYAYFKYCSLCGAQVYTGGYATKAHGSGAWGSGTCPSCGTHSYSGQSCTSSGSCACGATIVPYGNLPSGDTYSEIEHPHAYYKF